jgi:hypothetical protein
VCAVRVLAAVCCMSGCMSAPLSIVAPHLQLYTLLQPTWEKEGQTDTVCVCVSMPACACEREKVCASGWCIYSYMPLIVSLWPLSEANSC